MLVIFLIFFQIYQAIYSIHKLQEVVHFILPYHLEYILGHTWLWLAITLDCELRELSWQCSRDHVSTGHQVFWPDDHMLSWLIWSYWPHVSQNTHHLSCLIDFTPPLTWCSSWLPFHVTSALLAWPMIFIFIVFYLFINAISY